MKYPYMVKTSNNYEVTGPDNCGEIDVEGPRDQIFYFNKADLELMLARFEPAHESNCDSP